MSKNFYQKHTLFNLECISSVDRIARRKKQPGFIQMLSINKQAVAFLGKKRIDEEALIGKNIRIDRMVLPEFSRMVRANVLLKKITEDDNDKAVNMKDKGLFYPGELDESVLLNVCGTLEDNLHLDQHFHSCKMRKNTSRLFHHSGNGFETCPDTVLTSSISESENTDEGVDNIENELLLFYISSKGIIKSNKRIKNEPKHPGTHHPGNFLIQQILQQYFEDNSYEGSVPVDIDWTSKKILGGILKGIFLIPMLFSDQRIVYYCLLNVNGKSNIDFPIKTLLKEWIGTIANHNIDKNTVFIRGNDGGYTYLEEWSIFISKNNLIESGKKE